MTEITADQAMRQSWMTAHDGMLNAKADVEKLFGPLKSEVAATLVAAYMNAAAIDYLAWTVFRLTEEVSSAIDGAAQAVSNLEK